MIKNLTENKVYSIYKLFLFLTFSIIFLPQTLILNEDINLILAYEVDPGSLIISINNLFNFPYYNMFNGYHTTYYGWTYATLTFFFLLPFKFIFYILKIDPTIFTIFLVRFSFYLIGLFSLLILFRLCRKFLGTKNLVISFFIVILFIFSPFPNLFYFLHPETTGMLFTFLAVNYLLDYENKSKKKFYYYSLVCLVLAALSKQQFFISSVFLTIFSFFLFCNKNKIIFFTSFFFKEILKVFLLSFFIFFLVHPYAFLMPFKFFFSQTELASSFSTAKNNLNFLDALTLWLNLYKSNSFFLISIFLNVLSIIIIFFKNKSFFLKIFSFFLLLIIIFTLLYFSVGNKANISFIYFQAIYSVVFFQLLLFLKIIFDYSFFTKIQFKIFLIFSLLIFSFYNLSPTAESLQQRFSYKEGLAYRSYEYVKDNLSTNDKIAHDHHIAIPFSMDNISCHYWRSCNNYDRIANFNPKYVAFLDPLPVWGWSDNLEGKALKKYVENNKMKLVKTIYDKNSNSKILFFKINNF
jgi:hypothetical protein